MSLAGLTYVDGWNSTVKEARAKFWGHRAWKLHTLMLTLAVTTQFLADDYRHRAKMNLTGICIFKFQSQNENW
jgi:hypothetical protein